MGMLTDAKIKAWQDERGIEPATGARLKALNDLQQQAFELIRVAELEKSGIRDGDGGWHGSDALGGSVAFLNEAYQRLEAIDKPDPEVAALFPRSVQERKIPKA